MWPCLALLVVQTHPTNIRDIQNYSLQLISTVQSRLGKVWVDSDYLSEDYLVRCLERKGGHPKGTVASYRDLWGVRGRKKVGSD